MFGSATADEERGTRNEGSERSLFAVFLRLANVADSNKYFVTSCAKKCLELNLSSHFCANVTVYS